MKNGQRVIVIDEKSAWYMQKGKITNDRLPFKNIGVSFIFDGKEWTYNFKLEQLESVP